MVVEDGGLPDQVCLACFGGVAQEVRSRKVNLDSPRKRVLALVVLDTLKHLADRDEMVPASIKQCLQCAFRLPESHQFLKVMCRILSDSEGTPTAPIHYPGVDAGGRDTRMTQHTSNGI